MIVGITNSIAVVLNCGHGVNAGLLQADERTLCLLVVTPCLWDSINIKDCSNGCMCIRLSESETLLVSMLYASWAADRPAKARKPRVKTERIVMAEMESGLGIGNSAFCRWMRRQQSLLACSGYRSPATLGLIGKWTECTH